ncbi:hypothetical protein [Erwinia phage vB_Ea277G]|nr:hypothetical protein [Erwinia phage vB_Ea277G]
MKYYKLDPVEKEFHNQLLVNTLRKFITDEWQDPEFHDTVFSSLKDFSPNGTGRIFRAGAVNVGMVVMYNIGKLEGVNDWWEKAWREFGNLNLEGEDFDKELNSLIDKTVASLNRVRTNEDKIVPAIIELEDVRTFFQEASRDYIHSYRKKILAGALIDWYKAKQLDSKFVGKIVEPILNADTPEEFKRRAEAVIKHFTTPMN